MHVAAEPNHAPFVVFIRTTRTRGGGAVVVAMVRVVGVGMAVADGGDEGDGMMLMEVVTKMVTRVEWQRGGDGEARGGACVGGSGRSGDEVHFWSWPEYSPENFSGGG
ncbi:hypothetical protein Tco_0759333 [Tanacetum coccineum]